MLGERLSRLAPDWLFTYTGTILLVALLVNLATSFVQFSHSLTLPSMESSLDLSHTKAGLLITVIAAVRMGSALVAGTLAPRYGSRVIISIGSVGVGGSMLLLGYAQNYTGAVLAVALMGVASGAALTPMMGLLSSWFRVQDRGLAAGLAATGGSVAFIFTGIAVPLFVDADPLDGWRHSWRLFGVVVLFIGLISLAFIRERPTPDNQIDPPHSEGPRRLQRGGWPIPAFKSPMVWTIAFLAFTAGWSQNLFTTFFGVYLSQENDVSLSTVGQLVILMGVLSVGSGVLWGRMSDHIGRAQAFLYSFIIQAAAFALLSLVPGMGSFVTASILMGITLRATYTVCAASSGDYVPIRFSAAAFALMSVGASLGSTISPTLGGAVADNLDMRWTFALALCGSFAGTAGALFLQTRKPLSESVQPCPDP